MFSITLSPEEGKNILVAINAAIKVSDNAIQASAALLPVAAKIEQGMNAPAEQQEEKAPAEMPEYKAAKR